MSEYILPAFWISLPLEKAQLTVPGQFLISLSIKQLVCEYVGISKVSKGWCQVENIFKIPVF